MKAISTPSELNVCTACSALAAATGPCRAHPYHFAAARRYGSARNPRQPEARTQGNPMASSAVPHLANDQGVEKIFIGVQAS